MKCPCFFVTEAKAGVGQAAKPEAETSGGVVPKPKSKVSLCLIRAIVLVTRCSCCYHLVGSRTKLKQTETDRELLKRCCDTLTEENRRLQREVQELRDLKLSGPQCYMHTTPPTTLSLCPSCERISNSATTTAVFHRSRPFSMPIRRVLSSAHANRSSS